MNNPESDADLQIDEKKEYYVLTAGFFKFFYNAYGCNQLIQLKYMTIRESVEINIDALE